MKRTSEHKLRMVECLSCRRIAVAVAEGDKVGRAIRRVREETIHHGGFLNLRHILVTRRYAGDPEGPGLVAGKGVDVIYGV